MLKRWPTVAEGLEVHRKMGLIYMELQQYDAAIQEFQFILKQERKPTTFDITLGRHTKKRISTVP
jgi:methyl coenzyme M reductase subunit D